MVRRGSGMVRRAWGAVLPTMTPVPLGHGDLYLEFCLGIKSEDWRAPFLNLGAGCSGISV